MIVDMRGSTFTGTAEENSGAMAQVARRVIREEFGREAFLAGARQ